MATSHASAPSHADPPSTGHSDDRPDDRRSLPPQPASAWKRNLNLTQELAITQFKLKYTGSALGYLWSLVKPLMIFTVMYLVFSLFLRVASPFELLVGIVVYNFFSETVGSSVHVIASNGNLIQKAFFPRYILVVAATLSAMLTFLINMILIFVIGLIFNLMPGLHLSTLAIIPLMFELYLLIIGSALILSALFAFYRDVGHLWEVGSLVLFYSSAVVFPLSFAQIGPHYRRVLAMNPLAQIIQDARHVLVGALPPTINASGPPTLHPQPGWTSQLDGVLPGPWGEILPIAIVCAVFLAGVLTFRALAPRFAEYL